MCPIVFCGSDSNNVISISTSNGKGMFIVPTYVVVVVLLFVCLFLGEGEGRLDGDVSRPTCIIVVVVFIVVCLFLGEGRVDGIMFFSIKCTNPLYASSLCKLSISII